jgi:hypothetical protein
MTQIFKAENGVPQHEIRRMSQEEFDREELTPDEELEQEMPTTDVGENEEEEESDDVEESTADALAEAFKRVAKGRTDTRDISGLKVTERKANPAQAPAETSHAQTSDALAAAIEKLRETA